MITNPPLLVGIPSYCWLSVKSLPSAEHTRNRLGIPRRRYLFLDNFIPADNKWEKLIIVLKQTNSCIDVGSAILYIFFASFLFF